MLWKLSMDLLSKFYFYYWTYFGLNFIRQFTMLRIVNQWIQLCYRTEKEVKDNEPKEEKSETEKKEKEDEGNTTTKEENIKEIKETDNNATENMDLDDKE